jgi:hypothetical protein
MVDTTVILAGAIPAALLALTVDAGLQWVERQLSVRRRSPRRRAAAAGAALVAAIVLLTSGLAARRTSGAIIVGSKNFTEQLVLGDSSPKSSSATPECRSSAGSISAALSSATALCGQVTSMSTLNTPERH